jgi:hypothetical protein
LLNLAISRLPTCQYYDHNFHQFSPTFADFRQFSPISVNFRQFAPIFVGINDLSTEISSNTSNTFFYKSSTKLNMYTLIPQKANFQTSFLSQFGQVFHKNHLVALPPTWLHQHLKRGGKQGCQVVYFQTKNPNFDIYLYIFIYILEGLGVENFDIFYGYLVIFVVVWHILWSFGIFSPVLSCCTKTNLATLAGKWMYLKYTHICEGEIIGHKGFFLSLYPIP